MCMYNYFGVNIATLIVKIILKMSEKYLIKIIISDRAEWSRSIYIILPVYKYALVNIIIFNL